VTRTWPEPLLEAALERHAEALGRLPGVSGVGIAADPVSGNLAVAVYVRGRPARLVGGHEQDIPTHLNVRWRGRRYRVPVSVIELGQVRPDSE